MGEDFICHLGEQLTGIDAPERLELVSGVSASVKVKLYPIDQAMGRRVTATASNSAVSINSSAIVDEYGEAVFYLNANGSGNTEITFTISGSSLTACTTVTGVDPLSFSTLKLPSSLTVIKEEAFAGIAAVTVVIPDSCERIESNAFANCPSLKYIIVPANSSVDIAEDAFGGKDVTIIRK